MVDCLKIMGNELLQCRNDIITHWDIQKLNGFELKIAKFLGIHMGEIKVGKKGKEYTLMKCHGKDRVIEMQETFKNVLTEAQKIAPFVYAGDQIWINMNNLRKIKKTMENRDKFYVVNFKDGYSITLDEISGELRQTLHARDAKRIQKKLSENEELQEDERQ